jgi:hypothetical protein
MVPQHSSRRHSMNQRAFKQGTLTEGEDSVQFTSLFRSAAFDTTNTNFFYETSYLNEEVNRTDPFPSVRVPCLKHVNNS